MKQILAVALATAAMACGDVAFAQPPAQGPAVAGLVAPPIAPTSSVRLVEGTELKLQFEDAISSGSAVIGDRFTVSLAEPLTIAPGVVLPAGFRGVGEVTAAQKKGMMGKGGELSVRVDYLKVGETRIRLRGAQGGSGSGAVGTTVTLVVLFGPLGLLKHGHDMEIPKGQALKAYVDQDVDLPLPIAAPIPAG